MQIVRPGNRHIRMRIVTSDNAEWASYKKAITVHNIQQQRAFRRHFSPKSGVNVSLPWRKTPYSPSLLRPIQHVWKLQQLSSAHPIPASIPNMLDPSPPHLLSQSKTCNEFKIKQVEVCHCKTNSNLYLIWNVPLITSNDTKKWIGQTLTMKWTRFNTYVEINSNFNTKLSSRA
jgi:hypothetical protein